mmetsp:Transcript_11865/g.25074  ORF Transcript_11865/g.25074 Transcript_11865/m.25074 type:complete len:84 (+) Transcript_11865:274-525(+)
MHYRSALVVGSALQLFLPGSVSFYQSLLRFAFKFDSNLCQPALLHYYFSFFYNFFGLKTLYRTASIKPSVVKVPPMMAHKLVR